MAFGFASSLVRTSYAFTRQFWQQIDRWESLAARPELQNASLAIVGNAGYLAELDQGAQIDAHDVVLRMNNFRTKGFETQVGARTDVFLSTYYDDVNLQNEELAQAKLLISAMPYNLWRSRRQGVLHVHGAHIARALSKLERRQVFVPDWDFFLALKQQLGKYPTTGAMAVLLATNILSRVCRSIYFTGFSFFRGKSHYFRDQQTVPRNHDMQREEEVVRELLRPHVAAQKVLLDPQMSAQLNLTNE